MSETNDVKQMEAIADAAYVRAKARLATQPTPDRDAVREALVRILDNAVTGQAVIDLATALGVYETMRDVQDLADALLSRAQPEGKQPCTNPHNETGDPNRHCWHERDYCCHCETSRDATRPAPVVTEAARALIEKLDAIDADPRYQRIWQFADAHGVRYNGPTYEAELFALRAALAATRGEG